MPCTVQPANARVIIINITRLNTEAQWDTVDIYDGFSAAAPLLGRFSGSTVPTNPVTSSGNTVLVRRLSPFVCACNGPADRRCAGRLQNGREHARQRLCSLVPHEYHLQADIVSDIDSILQATRKAPPMLHTRRLPACTMASSYALAHAHAWLQPRPCVRGVLRRVQRNRHHLARSKPNMRVGGREARRRFQVLGPQDLLRRRYLRRRPRQAMARPAGLVTMCGGNAFGCACLSAPAVWRRTN